MYSDDDAESDNRKDKENIFKSRFYFDLGDALRDVQLSYGAKETAANSAALLGKTVSNIGVFSIKAAVEIIKNAPENLQKTIERESKK